MPTETTFIKPFLNKKNRKIREAVSKVETVSFLYVGHGIKLAGCGFLYVPS